MLTRSVIPVSIELRPESAATKRRLTLWDVATRKKLATLDGHTAVVESVAFSPDGKTLATGSYDSTAKLWDWAKEKETLSLDNESHCFRLTFSPDGKSLATAGDKLTLWDVEKGERRTTLEASANAIVFSPDAKTLATGMYVSGPRTGDFTEPTGAVMLWDVATGKQLDNLKVEGVVLSVAFSAPDGKILAVGCRGKEKQPISVSLNEKGEVVPEVQGDREGSVRLWELKRKKVEKR